MAIRTAKAVIEEVPEASKTSLAALAKCSESHSERDVHKMTSKMGLAIPIPISEAKCGDSTIPFLKMSDWAKYLESKNLWHTLCGQKVPNHEKCDECWGLFWEKYKKVNPGHEVFSRAARKEINLKKTAALLLHGDEGRSLKKSAILIVACHSVLGYGLTTSSASCKKEPHKLNYQRPTWTTRFLNAVVPKVYYSHEDGDRCFQQILGAVAEDLRFLYEHGVQGPHGTHYYCVVNIVGDWPWLVKSGCLGRSFHNVSRHGNTSENAKPSNGICHRCCADMGNTIWEDFEADYPQWTSTINKVSPFLSRPALLALPHNRRDPSSYWAWDLFHAWHLGSGKTFLSSAFVCIVMSNIFQGSIESKFGALNEHYFAWSKAFKAKPIRKFGKDVLSLTTTSTFPSGTWSKGSVTTQLMKYFLAFCQDHREQVGADPLLSLAFQAAENMNMCLSLLYSFELFIPAPEAGKIALRGLNFLKIQCRAARVAHGLHRNVFLYLPNLHRLHEIWWGLQIQANTLPFAISPLHTSCQADEDFIGRPSRVSRRVSVRLQVLRTLQRSLQCAYAMYCKFGHIVPDV